jgi:hypothetical protein
MKFSAALLFVLLCSSFVFADQTITLPPGASWVSQPGSSEATTVICSGSANNAVVVSKFCTCEVFRELTLHLVMSDGATKAVGIQKFLTWGACEDALKSDRRCR